jgi:hypothetical protein
MSGKRPEQESHLTIDPEKEQVIGDDEANLLLRDGDRGYRSPYVVPEEV